MVNMAVVFKRDSRELSHWNFERGGLCISKEHIKLTYFNMVWKFRISVLLIQVLWLSIKLVTRKLCLRLSSSLRKTYKDFSLLPL